MKFVIHKLHLDCKRERDELAFTRFSYYYGQMGAGKSTIARLIDFCLGGNLEYTPALQQEFVSATLDISIEGNDILLSRHSQENKIRAQWSQNGEQYDVLIPGRKAEGEVLPGTGVEVLSDLLFHIAGIKPPRVRKSKVREDSEIVRLSFRDLFWYCYLDQDAMDSSFFNLDDNANPFVRLKSRDVLRFIIGFHQEQVSDLEAELEEVRENRLRLESAAQAIKDALEAEDLATPLEIQALRLEIGKQISEVETKITAIRTETGELRTHQVELLRITARDLSNDLAELDNAIEEIEQNVAKDKSHRNTLLSLATRQKRAQSARSVLTGVQFAQCPQCYQTVPNREQNVCPLCGQIHSDIVLSPLGEDSVEADTTARAQELAERIRLQETESKRLMRQRNEIATKKSHTDRELDQASKEYDSSYLASALALERERAGFLQRIVDLKQMEVLANKVSEMIREATRLTGREAEIRAELRNARKEAEKDTSNLELLKTLFLDCLLRSKLHGFLADDFVEIKSPSFLPEVHGRNTGDFVNTSFANLGSGGKKTFFKCCFAVAVHRLAARVGGILPEIMIIDSPMKNISERENPDQFAGFHEMLHEMAETELKGTQFIVIDKEIFRPKQTLAIEFQERHMKPDDPLNPPLIRNYRGK